MDEVILLISDYLGWIWEQIRMDGLKDIVPTTKVQCLGEQGATMQKCEIGCFEGHHIWKGIRGWL